MSIFNFRRGRPASESASVVRSASAAATESVEMVRKRVRQRLIGSAVLVLIGVVGFPLLFETQPRPVPVDIAIDIPSRAGVKPNSPILPVTRSELAAPAPETLAATPAVAQSSPAPVPLPAQASLQDKEEILQPAPQSAKAEPKPESKPAPKSPVKPEAVAKLDDGQRAQALLEAAPSKSATADARIVIQVGAFSDAAKAREARAKLEKAGLKTYTQMADTKDGTRIRVRLGPYASKAEAEKAAAKVKALNLPAAILVL